jgi:Spy/CpxP family protein refolding chaperone
MDKDSSIFKNQFEIGIEITTEIVQELKLGIAMNKSAAPLSLILCMAISPAIAPAIADEQNKSEPPLTVGTHLPAPTTTSLNASGTPNSAAPVSQEVLIANHLSLQNGQIERLNRLYDAYATERIKQEKNLDEWHIQLKIAQAPATFDEGKASRLMRDINKAQQRVADSFLSTRSKALDVLNETQRIQLQALASDSKIKVRNDKLFQLLMLAPSEFWRLPIDSDSERRLLSEREYKERQKRNSAVGSYGVYAGYGWGRPDYGIYGGYGRDGVGVNVGIGRGGPSIGINIGNVFRIGR